MIPACVRGLAGGLAMAALFILTVARRENRRDANSIATAHSWCDIHDIFDED